MSEILESKAFKDTFFNLKNEKRPDYDQDVSYQSELAVHAYGKKPIEILERNRPREDDEIKEYRLESYEPITTSRWNESIKVLKKMFNDSLFTIVYPDPINGIAEGDELKTYIDTGMPIYGNLIEYLKEQGLKKVVGNPNGYFVVMPGVSEIETEYNEPYPVFFNEDTILWDIGYYIIYLSGEIGKDGKYLYIDAECMAYLSENSSGQKHTFTVDQEIVHSFGVAPMWRAGGNYDDDMYKSFFDAAVPFWNKAVSKNSDVDAVEVNFAFPHFWSVEIDCKECEGEGRIEKTLKEGGSTSFACRSCQGSGKTLNQSPFNYFAVNEDKLRDNPAIAPPMGFESPNSDIIKHLDDKVDRLITQGLEAVKMHVVIGQNQSGKSKEWDRSEMNESIKEVSDWMFNIHYKNIVHFCNLWRYLPRFKSIELLVKQEPIITSPVQFNTLTINDITEEIAKSSQSDLNNHYLNALTKEANDKRFGQNPEINQRLNLYLVLDPFSGVSQEDKMIMLSDRTVRREDVIMSNNIKQFVEKAIQEHNNFINEPYSKQYEIIFNYSKDFLDAEQEPIESGPED